MKNELTWRCHVCGRERDDADISVRKFEVPMRGGGEVAVNVRYCNDNAACYEGAEETDLVQSVRKAFGSPAQ